MEKKIKIKSDSECPVCGESIDNYYPQEEFDGSHFHQDWSCSNCESYGRFVYEYRLDHGYLTKGSKDKNGKNWN